MRYVLDASVALRTVLPDTLSPKAELLCDQYKSNVHEFIAPSIYTGEIAGALTKAERQKLIAVGDARKHFAGLASWSPLLTPYESLLFRAIDISSVTRCGFYDALYAELGEQTNCEVITADDKFYKAVSATCPFVIALSMLP